MMYQGMKNILLLHFVVQFVLEKLHSRVVNKYNEQKGIEGEGVYV